MSYFNETSNTQYPVGDYPIYQGFPQKTPLTFLVTSPTYTIQNVNEKIEETKMTNFEMLKEMLESIKYEVVVEDEKLQGQNLTLTLQIINVDGARFVFNQAGTLILVA